MIDDPSRGWEAVAHEFAAIRSNIGADVVARWSAHLPAGGSIVDIGCGTGVPIATALAGLGFEIYGIDPAPTNLAAFQRNLPGASAACEAAEVSRFFDRRFDGAIAIGLMFLLPEAVQRALIIRVAEVLHPGGRFLFTAPWQEFAWDDTLTGRRSASLGRARYRQLLESAGYRVTDGEVDAGGNHYFDAVRPGG